MHTYQNVCGNSVGKKRGRTILTPEGSLLDELYELPKRGKDLRRLIHKTVLQRRLDLRKRIFLMATPKRRGELYGEDESALGAILLSDAFLTAGRQEERRQTAGNSGTQSQRLRYIYARCSFGCTGQIRQKRRDTKAISRSTFLCDSLGCIWQTIGNDGTQNQRLKCLWRNARSVTGLFASEVFAKKGSLL